MNKFHYVRSCDVNSPFKLKMISLNNLDEIIDKCLLYSKKSFFIECQFHSCVLETPLCRCSSFKTFKNDYRIDEWINFTINYKDIKIEDYITLTLYGIGVDLQPEIVGSVKVNIFNNDGLLLQGIHNIKLTSMNYQENLHDSLYNDSSSIDENVLLYNNGYIPKVEWLDKIVFEEIEKINLKKLTSSNYIYMTVEFSNFIVDNIACEMIYHQSDFDYTQESAALFDVFHQDPGLLQENACEAKYRKLLRFNRNRAISNEKPNSLIRDKLKIIIAYSPANNLSEEEKDLLWQYRTYLSSDKKAITKFLKCVDWNNEEEVLQAKQLMKNWTPLDASDALELLSPSFSNEIIRRYAVSRLRQASNSQLISYLLQLVQSLRYESNNVPLLDSTCSNQSTSELLSPIGSLDSKISSTFSSLEINNDENMSLSTFLVNRALEDDVFANYFFWYLHIASKETNEIKDNVFKNVMRNFSKALLTSDIPGCRKRRRMLASQVVFVKQLSVISNSLSQLGNNSKKKTEKLRKLLEQPEYVFKEPIQLPLAPHIEITHFIPEKCFVFKSAMNPLKLTMSNKNKEEYSIIFKNGDDLRQDQLVVQILSLMSQVLMNDNLDMMLTPYAVIATDSEQGMIEFIESNTIADILSTEGSILNFFRKHSFSDTDPFSIQRSTMESYVKSCAGYCIITYILGVGDRHLDNLMLMKSGKIFHIDFGFILGRDPKPFPPPMKLSKEMVDGMGGTNSQYFADFKKLCYTVFLHLRRHSNFFVNLFSLMIDANVRDIAIDPNKAVSKIQEKFLLHLNDEEAVHHIQNLIDESVSAVVATVVEQIHKWAQYWRK